MKYYEEKKNVVYMHYDSIRDLHEDNPTLESNISKYKESVIQRSQRIGWYGMPGSAKEIMEKLVYGWDEGAKQISKIGETLSFNIGDVQSMRRKRVRSHFGDHIDMQSVYSGNLSRAWETTKREASLSSGKQSVLIMVDLATSANVNASSGFYKGATAALIADKYQTAGRSVSIVTTANTKNSYYNDKDLMLSLCVKEFDQPMSPEEIAAVTSMAFFRTFFFKGILNSPYEVAWGMGSPQRREKRLPLHLEDTLNSKVIYVPSSIETESAARKFIEEHIGVEQ